LRISYWRSASWRRPAPARARMRSRCPSSSAGSTSSIRRRISMAAASRRSPSACAATFSATPADLRRSSVRHGRSHSAWSNGQRSPAYISRDRLRSRGSIPPSSASKRATSERASSARRSCPLSLTTISAPTTFLRSWSARWRLFAARSELLSGQGRWSAASRPIEPRGVEAKIRGPSAPPCARRNESTVSLYFEAPEEPDLDHGDGGR
jgi:hypothetical protein